jgi:hypothetical protein
MEQLVSTLTPFMVKRRFRFTLSPADGNQLLICPDDFNKESGSLFCNIST